MLELFLASLEEQLGLIINPPLAPIARMNIISLEITRLIYANKQRDAPVHAEQKCPFCSGEGYLPTEVGFKIKCSVCNGTGISNRSAGG